MQDNPIRLDDTDRQLISLLRDDARISISALAAKLRVSRGTVQNRLSKLEDSGVIAGYTVRLRQAAQPARVRAWMTIVVEGSSTPEVIRALRGEPAVTALHSTNGRWDIVAEISADHLEAFDLALGRIRLIKGIVNTETHILLSTHKI